MQISGLYAVKKKVVDVPRQIEASGATCRTHVDSADGMDKEQMNFYTETLQTQTCNIKYALAWRHILVWNLHRLLWQHRVASEEDRAVLWPNHACEQAYRGRQGVS